MRFAKWLFNLIASYGFAVVVLFFLLLLTLFGTLAQVELGIFEAQKKYFESFFLVHTLFDTVPLPLPGGSLLMILLFFNLLFGGIIRARKDWRRPGMLIAHGGIIFLLLAGFVTYKFSRSGHMTLYEQEQSDEIVSYYDWEVTIRKADAGPDDHVYVIPHDDFADLGPGEERTFQVAGLPFALTLEGFLKNCQPRPATGQYKEVDGVELVPLPLETEAEQNVAGIYATVQEAESGASREGILWGLDYAPWLQAQPGRFQRIPPWKVTVGGVEWVIEFQHERWKVPFAIALNKFTRELHPGTGMAASFMSNVSKIEDGNARDIDIKMNEPLRHRGFTFFQASWGPQDARPGEPLFSTFAVVENPADQWPKYACYVIAIGLIIHFGQKLTRYLQRESRKRA